MKSYIPLIVGCILAVVFGLLGSIALAIAFLVVGGAVTSLQLFNDFLYQEDEDEDEPSEFIQDLSSKVHNIDSLVTANIKELRIKCENLKHRVDYLEQHAVDKAGPFGG